MQAHAELKPLLAGFCDKILLNPANPENPENPALS